jgi:general secretion pathway protein I
MSRSLVRGFSLLELLVAVAVLAISLAMLYRAAGGVLQATSAVQMQQTAVQVAQSVLNSREYLSSSGWHEKGSDAGIDWSVSSVPIPDAVNSTRANPVRLHEVSLKLVWQGRSERVYWSIHTILPETVASAVASTPSQ